MEEPKGIYLGDGIYTKYSDFVVSLRTISGDLIYLRKEIFDRLLSFVDMKTDWNEGKYKTTFDKKLRDVEFKESLCTKCKERVDLLNFGVIGERLYCIECYGNFLNDKKKVAISVRADKGGVIINEK